jgi:mono/diheme cytochrome c family protein
VTAASRRGRRAAALTVVIGVISIAGIALAAGAARAAERDPIPPRVPSDQREAARTLVNPVPPTPESIARGKAIFWGVGSCNVCHGEDGDGNGIGASGLDPSPRDFTNPKWQKARTDGDLMWVLRHGSPGTAMITVVPGLISEADGWDVINFLRTFSGSRGEAAGARPHG